MLKTLISRSKRPSEGLHVRKSLLTIRRESQIDKIVDHVVRQIVKDAVLRNGSNNSQIPASTFFDTSPDGTLLPRLFLRNTKGGDPVPIKKVRIRELSSTDVNIKEGVNQFVIPTNNHHVLIYSDEQGVFYEEVISFWQAIKRKKKGEPVVQLPNPKKDSLVTTLKINDTFLMGIDDLEENLALESRSFLKNHLYRVQKLSSKFYEFRLAYKQTSLITDAPEYIRINNFGSRKTGWLTYNPVKVNISVIGQITRKKENI